MNKIIDFLDGPNQKTLFAIAMMLGLIIGLAGLPVLGMGLAASVGGAMLGIIVGGAAGFIGFFGIAPLGIYRRMPPETFARRYTQTRSTSRALGALAGLAVGLGGTFYAAKTPSSSTSMAHPIINERGGR
ncbi:MAG: hypothetical protein AB7G80_04410 [Dongiaceae bacterium]